MEEKLFEELKEYFGSDYQEEQGSVLRFCIKRAVSSFKNKRNYPGSYTETMIQSDMEKYHMCLFDLALYWTNMQGMEFQKNHSENGTTISWDSERDIYVLHDVIPIARIF